MMGGWIFRKLWQRFAPDRPKNWIWYHGEAVQKCSKSAKDMVSIPRKSDGGIDERSVTAIKIIEIINYH